MLRRVTVDQGTAAGTWLQLHTYLTINYLPGTVPTLPTYSHTHWSSGINYTTFENQILPLP